MEYVWRRYTLYNTKVQKIKSFIEMAQFRIVFFLDPERSKGSIEFTISFFFLRPTGRW